MRFILSSWLLFFLFLGACTHELEIIEQPNDLIPPEQFEPVLKEMLMLEAQTRVIFNNVNDFYKILPKSANLIFEKHGIDSLRYVNSMNYYVQKQEVLMEMYQSILEEIERKDTIQ